MIRPELIRWITRHAELIACILVALLGLWISLRGGWFLAALGVAVLLLGAGLAHGAFNRIRFHRATIEPGVVIVDERRIGYFGPDTGGFFEMSGLEAVELMTTPIGAHWTLRGDSADLIVPTSAKGAEQLFDLFETLPGFPMSSALEKLEHRSTATYRLWPEQRSLTIVPLAKQ